MKTCYTCKIEKNTEDFDNDKSRPDGKFSYCKDCRREYEGREKQIRNVVGYYKDKKVCLSKGQVYPTIGNKRAHRYIMEDSLGRKLIKGECVHHKDGNKLNYHIKNLVVLKKKDHEFIHKPLQGKILICSMCDKSKYYNQGNLKRLSDNYTCKNCRIRTRRARGVIS